MVELPFLAKGTLGLLFQNSSESSGQFQQVALYKLVLAGAISVKKFIVS